MKDPKVCTSWIVPTAAIAGITLIEWQALEHGHDGFILSITIAAIAGIGGFIIRPLLLNRRERE